MNRPFDEDIDPRDELDPLSRNYRDAVAEPPDELNLLQAADVALLCIDLQYLDAAPGYGVFKYKERLGLSDEALEYYFGTLKEVVLPNVARLQKAFRDLGLEVIHTRIQSMTPDGRDRSPAHKRLGLHAAPGSKEAEFLDEVAPAPHEIIVNKTCSGVFSSTNIDFVLRNLGIRALYVVGVYTNECVSTTIRAASDLGYLTTIVQDGCTTVTPDLQASTLKVLRDRYCRVMRTGAVIREVERKFGKLS